MCKELGLPELRRLSCQSINRQLQKEVLQETSQSQELPRKRQVTMYSEEENAVRYASVYITMKLFEKMIV